MTIWVPQVGDKAVYRAYSVMTGKLVNIRIVTILKKTKAGFVYLKHDAGRKFRRANDKMFGEHHLRGHMSSYRTYLTEATEKDLADLPTNPMEGSRYAKTLNEREKST